MKFDESDFNYKVFHAINNNLIKRGIKNVYDAFDLLKDIEKDAIVDVLELDLKMIHKISGKSFDSFIFPDEFGGEWSNFLNTLFNSPFRILKKDVSTASLEDLLFFDNNVNVPDSNGKRYEDYREVDWNGFASSYLLCINIIRDTLRGGLESLNNLKDIQFINSERIVERRVFLDSEGSEFNRLINEYLLLEAGKSIRLPSFKNDMPISFESRRNFIDKWLNKFEIAEGYEVERNAEGIGSLAFLIINGKKTLLADVGYGINKLFPLILKIAISNKNSTIFIEEPESNLHPAMQSKLADLFVDAHQVFGHYFVLETHSEYLIRKLQFLVASEKSNAKAEDINIYYFYHPDKIPEGKKQVEKLEMREDGILKQDFGKGFFDESVMLTIDLLKNQRSN